MNPIRALPHRIRPYLTQESAVRLAGLRFDLHAALGRAPVIVYQMGKVGSRSVYEALTAAGLPNPVYHVHTLSNRGLRLAQKKEDGRGRSTPSSLIVHGQMLAARLDRPHRPRWKIVTMVREPVRTFLSHVFFDPHIHRPFLLRPDGTLDPAKTHEYIVLQLRGYDERRTYIPAWFDREFNVALGVDVYAHPFDPARGFGVIAGERDDILILRLEDTERVFDEAMTGFLPSAVGAPLRKSNVNEASPDAGQYRRVRNTLVLPEDVLRRVYATRLAAHFYSEQERAALVRYWSTPRESG